MPSLTIDGREITVPEGTTVIQAAEELGVFIPRYCYHPGLSMSVFHVCACVCLSMHARAMANLRPAASGAPPRTRSRKPALMSFNAKWCGRGVL